MRKIASILFIGLFAAEVYAGAGHSHVGKKHCEKKVDGKAIHLEHVKDRKLCKQEGGRWVKNKKENHGSHEGHKGKDQHGHEHEEGSDHK